MDRLKREERERDFERRQVEPQSFEARKIAGDIITEIFQTIKYVREPAVKGFLDALLDDKTLVKEFWEQLFPEIKLGLNDAVFFGDLAFEHSEILHGTRQYILYARVWYRALFIDGAVTTEDMRKYMQPNMKSGGVEDFETGDFIRCFLISAIQFAISMENKIVTEAIYNNPRTKFKFDALIAATNDGKLKRKYNLDDMAYVSSNGMPRVKNADGARHTMDEFNSLNFNGNGNGNSAGEDPLPLKAPGHRLHNRNTRVPASGGGRKTRRRMHRRNRKSRSRRSRISRH